ncbi:hypothetical protein Dda_1064 [Drechslerella dactyloides]|uniref:Uncharacterized protein n=1 Tax=Drechslerella dactyloides TaxID=74499 RepID=A0AAD6NMN4_DREDA|nr:hypothetical protein Dda_1064 [Drechslerella dactyloides]
MDSVRQQLEAFRFPSPTPTIRAHKIWSAQHLEPYLPSPRTLPPSESSSSYDYSDPNFVDSAYSSPLMEEPPMAPEGSKAMTLLDTLSELESIVRKYEVNSRLADSDSEDLDRDAPVAAPPPADEPRSFWDDDSSDDDDSDDDLVDEAYDSGCFTEDDESFETRLASLQPPTKRPRLSDDALDDATSARPPFATWAPGVAIVKPSASLRLSKRMRMKRRQVSIPRSTPAGVSSSNYSGSTTITGISGPCDWWSLRKPSPAFIDTFQF